MEYWSIGVMFSYSPVLHHSITPSLQLCFCNVYSSLIQLSSSPDLDAAYLVAKLLDHREINLAGTGNNGIM